MQEWYVANVHAVVANLVLILQSKKKYKIFEIKVKLTYIIMNVVLFWITIILFNYVQ